jgi:hypothetical protein
MSIDLDEQELSTMLESLKYSKQRVRDAQGTPYEVRRQNLERLDAVEEKLRRVAKS